MDSIPEGDEKAQEVEPFLENSVLQEEVQQETPADVAELAALFSKEASKAEAKAKGLRLQLQDASEAELWRRRGNALQAAPQEAWSEKLKTILAQVDEGEHLAILLPCPGKSFEENASHCFKQADKLERACARCAPLVLEADKDVEYWRGMAIKLAKPFPPPDVLAAARKLHAELCPAPKGAQRLLSRSESNLRRKYGKGIDTFRSPSGHEVIVGRSAGTNERVSFELTSPDSFWFHSDCGVAGSHVTIACPASEVASLEDVEFAAGIAAWHSKARGHALASVCYCYGAQVTRPSVPKLGLVHIVGRRGSIEVVPRRPPAVQC